MESGHHVMLWLDDRICFKAIGYLYHEFGGNILSNGNLDFNGHSHFHLQQDSRESDAECPYLLPGNAVYLLPDRSPEPRGIFRELHDRLDSVRTVFACHGLFCMVHKRKRNVPENCECGNPCGFSPVICPVF